MAEEKWGMVVDLDKCTGCQACVVACQSENNIPINEEGHFNQRRAIEWIRVERYWEGEFPDVKARFIPLFCQQCGDAPCEPVCPVFATYHNPEGLNVQVYNRCIGTRFCANNCPYQVRFFNFWEPAWPDSLKNQLNPDVTVRSRGIMEKCTFCIQRIRRSTREAGKDGVEIEDGDRALNPACVNACPTDALIFGDIRDVADAEQQGDRPPKEPKSRAGAVIAKELLARDKGRGYRLLEDLGTHPSVVYLKKVDKEALEVDAHG
jgi:molybdopterin-containing oxidoreductase family iron-sulfur binding subunit